MNAWRSRQSDMEVTLQVFLSFLLLDSPMVAVGEAGSGARYAAALCVMYWLLLSYPITLAIASVATILVTALLYLKTLLRRRDSVARLTCKDSALSHYVTLHCHAFRRALQLPVWCRNPHLQTFLGLWAGEPGVQFDRKYMQLADKGLVALDWEVGGEHLPRGRPLLLVLPDLPQSALQVAALCREAFDYGLRAVVVNRRGQGGSPVHTARLPAYGDTSDLREVVEFLLGEERGGVPISAVGVGTGGDLLLSYLGEYGSSARLASAVCISPSYAAERVLHEELSFPYSALYLSHVKRAVLRHARVFGKVAQLARSAWSLKELDRRLYCCGGGQDGKGGDGAKGAGAAPESLHEGEGGADGHGELGARREGLDEREGEAGGAVDGRHGATTAEDEGEGRGGTHHHHHHHHHHYHDYYQQHLHKHHRRHHDSVSEGSDGHRLHADLDAFWADNEPLREADEISAPLLCVSALDDPVCPAAHIQHDLFRALPNLFLLTLPLGGHAGFRQSPRGISWAESAAMDFVLTMLTCRLQQQHHHPHHDAFVLDDGSRAQSYAETDEKCFEYQCRADDDSEVEGEEERDDEDAEEEVYDSTDGSLRSEQGLGHDDVMYDVIHCQLHNHRQHHHHHHHRHYHNDPHYHDSHCDILSSVSTNSTTTTAASSVVTTKDDHLYRLDEGGHRLLACNSSSSNMNGGSSGHCPNGHCSSAVMAMAEVDMEKQLRTPTEAHG